MFSTADTIVAIATPPGRGGIGVVRVSGPDAEGIVRQLIAREASLVARHATLTTIRSTVHGVLDHVVVTLFPAPASYTGEHVVEISAHGSPVILKAIVTAAIESGARLAEPGEFTLRAFLNQRIDLAQAEAVADLIDAVTPVQARAAFDQLSGTLTSKIAAIDVQLFDLIARLEASIDFPEEGYHFVEPGALAEAIGVILAHVRALLSSSRLGRLVRDGLLVVIVGRPNAGKSSLFNALLGTERAIVTEVPGTTRDLVSEALDLDGLHVTLVDTAGLRETADLVETEGVKRSLGATNVADLILHVEDLSRPRESIEMAMFLQAVDNKTLVVGSKADLPSMWSDEHAVEVSVATGAGLAELRRRIVSGLDSELLTDRPEMTNVRHIALVEHAATALSRVHEALSAGVFLPEELVLVDLQEARGALEEVTGRRTSDDLLAHIFSRFCIGK